MTRQSHRIKERRGSSGDCDMLTVSSTSTSSNGALNEPDNNFEAEEHEEARPRKRAKKSSSNEEYQSTGSSTKKTKRRMPENFRKVRGKLGMLERLAKDVPLDVIFEIFCYLDPSDLLRLARTSNDLRGILMSKSSESIWRTTRSNVEGFLPPLPPDLNEPQYAHLLYESHCHVCDRKGRCDTVLWSFRMRCCKRCIAKFPRFYDQKFRASLPSEFEDHEILPKECVYVSQQYRDVGNFQIAARLCAEFEALENPEDRDAWIVRKTQERQTITAHAQQCEAWHQARLNEQTNKLNDIRNQRKEAILDRLGEIGWREEAEEIIANSYGGDIFTNHKSVKQSKKLTEYGWSSIKPELVHMLSTRKAKRLAEQQRHMISQRYYCLEQEYNNVLSATDLREPFPSVGDVFTHKVFEDLIWDSPENVQLTDVFFREKLAEHIPRIIDKWRPAKIQEVVEIIQKSRPNPSASAADLHLATCVFECTTCPARTKMHYPQMFYHPCCIRNPASNNERLKTYLSTYYGPTNIGPWMSCHIVFSTEGSRIAKTIVESCSLDPATATIQELCTANPLIECTTCYNDPTIETPRPGRAFMRWSFALGHSTPGEEHTLAINSFGEQTEHILSCEPDPKQFYWPWKQQEICCAHCHKGVASSLKVLVEHFKENPDHRVDVRKFEASYIKPEDIQEHWYWNPRVPLRALGEEFRYKLPPP